MNGKSENRFLFYVLLGIAISVAAVFVSLFIFAVIMHFADMDLLWAGPFATVALGTGCLIGSNFSSRKLKSRGLLTGLTVAGVQFALLSIIALGFSYDGVGMLTLIHAAVMLLSGAIGGVFGVNSVLKNKIKI